MYKDHKFSKEAYICQMNLGTYQKHVDKRLKELKESNFLCRLWKKDPTLWFPDPDSEITDRLGWLDLLEVKDTYLNEFQSFAEEIKNEGILHVVLLGMGGSSLAPEMFQQIFGNAEDFPELLVLDSVHPSSVLKVEKKIDLNRTLFIVASKSGTTTETLSLYKYFWHRVGVVNKDRGQHFIVITDPDTPLIDLAKERKFRRLFKARPDVGGRYSALSTFGLLPAALIGVDIHQLIERTQIMSENSEFCVSCKETSSLVLGATLGELALRGRDKITFITSPSIQSLPVWIEQLIAESTGKKGKGIIPIVNEPNTEPKNYDDDRVFIYYSNEDDRDQLEELLQALEEKKHPTIRIKLKEKLNISQEIFCWEVAVAAAGAILGVHPFNQPNVQLTKDLTRRMMEKAPGELSIQEKVNEVAIEEPKKVIDAFKSWIDQAKKKDYVSIHAYLSPSKDLSENIQKLRLQLLKCLKLATTAAYGPRFLHSTGQLHKGGPNSGLFIQLIDEPPHDLIVPETDYTFRELIQAQALGDYKALTQLGRRVLRINLKSEAMNNIRSLIKIINQYEEE